MRKIVLVPIFLLALFGFSLSAAAQRNGNSGGGGHAVSGGHSNAGPGRSYGGGGHTAYGGRGNGNYNYNGTGGGRRAYGGHGNTGRSGYGYNSRGRGGYGGYGNYYGGHGRGGYGGYGGYRNYYYGGGWNTWWPGGWYFGAWYGPGWYFPTVIYPSFWYWNGWAGYEYDYAPYVSASGVKFDLGQVPSGDRTAVSDGGVYLPDKNGKMGYLGTVGNFAGSWHHALPLDPGTYDLVISLTDGRSINMSIVVQPQRVTHVALRFDQPPPQQQSTEQNDGGPHQLVPATSPNMGPAPATRPDNQ